MKPKIEFKTGKVFIILWLYLLASSLLLWHYGIQTHGEAEKYIHDANNILSGSPLRNGIFSIFYIGYSLLISFFVKFNISFLFVGILQCLLSFVAATCMYKLLIQAGIHKKISFAFLIIYLLCYPIQKWNFYLYTESVHTSLIVITFYYLYCILSKVSTNWFTPIILLLLIIFTRPVGIIFIATLLISILYWLFVNKMKTYACIGLILLLGLLYFFIFSPYSTYINPDSLRRMEIICQVPEKAITSTYHEYNKEGIRSVFFVIKNEIGFKAFFINGMKKLGIFFGMIRPYYSLQHKGLLLIYLLLYPLAIIGLFIKKSKEEIRYIKSFSIIYIIFTSLLIFITCDDWSNRFISPMFSFVLFLAAFGSDKILCKFK